jgi:pseudouridine-5'-phosphate glycosidase
MEVLETQGVPVIGYGTDMLPAFYVRSSGLPLGSSVTSPQEAAQVIAASRRMGLTNGILFTVPVPSEDEMPPAEAESAIEQATHEAETQGIRGAALTPFLLARVAALTEGASRRANTSLLVNNARVAGQIALAHSRLEH